MLATRPRLAVVRRAGQLGMALALAAAAAACAHGGEPPSRSQEARAKPSCSACHDSGSQPRANGVALCAPCHGASHGGEVGRQMAVDPAEHDFQRCTICHDPHQAHR